MVPPRCQTCQRRSQWQMEGVLRYTICGRQTLKQIFELGGSHDHCVAELLQKVWARHGALTGDSCPFTFRRYIVLWAALGVCLESTSDADAMEVEAKSTFDLIPSVCPPLL